MLGRLFKAFRKEAREAPAAASLTIEPLAPGDVAFLDTRREFAARIVADFGDAVPGWQPTLGNVQALYDDGLERGLAEDVYYEAVAVLFGDELVARYGYEWVIVRDEYGVTPAVAVPRLEVYASPIDMILKRMEREERVDFTSLVEDTHSTLAELVAAGECRKR